MTVLSNTGTFLQQKSTSNSKNPLPTVSSCPKHDREQYLVNFFSNNPQELEIWQGKGLLQVLLLLKGIKRLDSNPPEQAADITSFSLLEMHPAVLLLCVWAVFILHGPSHVAAKDSDQNLSTNSVISFCRGAISGGVALISMSCWHERGLTVWKGIKDQVLKYFVWNNLGMFLHAVSNPALSHLK